MAAVRSEEDKIWVGENKKYENKIDKRKQAEDESDGSGRRC
jgi:hypothetical protein